MHLRPCFEKFGKVKKKQMLWGERRARRPPAPPPHSSTHRPSHICPLMTLPVITAYSGGDADERRTLGRGVAVGNALILSPLVQTSPPPLPLILAQHTSHFSVWGVGEYLVVHPTTAMASADHSYRQCGSVTCGLRGQLELIWRRRSEQQLAATNTPPMPSSK